MEIFETAAAQMALLFAMIAVGFGCRKKGVMNDEFDAKLSSLVLNVTMPCMIVAAVLNSTSFPSLDMVLEIIEWGSITYLFVTLIAIVIGHFVSSDDRTRGTLEYLMVFSNVSVIGFPLLNVIFGPRSGGVWRHLQYSFYSCHVDHWCNAACQQEGWGSGFTQGAPEEAGHFPDKPLYDFLLGFGCAGALQYYGFWCSSTHSNHHWAVHASRRNVRFGLRHCQKPYSRGV